jgi:anti-sigma factor RsiW
MPEPPEKHLPEDVLELHALDRLSGEEWAAAVEHLAGCPVCRDRLEGIEAYTAAMREALKRIAGSGGHS